MREQMKSLLRWLVAALVAMSLWTVVKQDYLWLHIPGKPHPEKSAHQYASGWQHSHSKIPLGACQLLPPVWQHASALALWTENLGKIHNASQLLPNDSDYEFSDLTAQLLHLISPRLPNSVKTLPRDWKSVTYVLEEVLYPRWRYVIEGKKKNNEIPRRVKIVVMGGSVVYGMNCLQVFSNKVRHSLSREECAWPYRLQQFLDAMVGRNAKGLFEVHTIAMGGSNTVSFYVTL